MLWLPKWLNKWLTETEEADLLVDPGRRSFLFGIVSTAIVLAAPEEVWKFKNGSTLSFRDMRIPLQLRPGGNLSLMGIPYHVQDQTSGLWLGMDRVTPAAFGPAPSMERVREAINNVAARLEGTGHYARESGRAPMFEVSATDHPPGPDSTRPGKQAGVQGKAETGAAPGGKVSSMESEPASRVTDESSRQGARENKSTVALDV